MNIYICIYICIYIYMYIGYIGISSYLIAPVYDAIYQLENKLETELPKLGPLWWIFGGEK